MIQRGSVLLGALSLAVAVSLPGTVAQAVELQFPVHSIDEVADGAMPEMTDISANSAVLIFNSSVPLACSVVFGETPDFGSVSIDTDMNGGAHSNHHPVLAGLLPDREYFFRVQGTAEDGTIYLGEVLSFTTAAEDANAEVNLASLSAGAQVTAVSSNYGSAANDQAWGANQAIDGDRTTAWSSAGDGDDGFIEITLGEETAIGDVSVWTRTMSNGTAQIFKFTITTDQGEVFGPFALADASQSYRFPIDTTASRLRLDVIESNGGNVGLVEFGAFAR
ncbi:MAG: discoidin domain-containing protein [Alphaproteobacteria bacterium]